MADDFYRCQTCGSSTFTGRCTWCDTAREAATNPPTESVRHETFGGGGYYAHDEPTLTRADLHGCLTEDVNTGEPLVCRKCAYPPEQSSTADDGEVL